MEFGANKTPVEVIKKGAFGEVLILETFIQVLTESGTASHGKSLIS